MQRIALGIEYAGHNYSGWQSQQDHVRSVQSELESAIAQVADHPIKVVCAGRTDAGVHACGQVVHCDVTAVRSEREWVFGCNRSLPRDIRVLWVKLVSDEFSARYSALGRHYKYVLYNNNIRPSLLGDYVAWHYYPLEVELMREAAQSWLGQHDFSSFRGANCQSKSPVRTIKSIQIKRAGDLIVIDIFGDAFLYHMVRNMVGVLLEIGTKKRSVAWAQEVLLARDRKQAGVTAPANGLYLVGVEYPSELQIPIVAKSLWFFN